jgi:hypothetical protein
MNKLKHRSILHVLFFAVFIIPLTYGQIIFTSTDATVYNFFERMSLKGIIEYNDEVKPFSRTAIGNLLLKISEQKEKLNELEQKELAWQFEEYSAETGYEDERFRLYSHRDSLFELTISPVAGYSLANNYGKTAYHRWWAFKFWGTYGNYFGASFEYRDNTESGSGTDRKKLFSPQTGYFVTSSQQTSFDYSDVRGSISLNWDWGSVSLIKDYMQWGHGKFGQLILSDKAPSFPHIRLQLQPSPWFRFNYIHGWLNSMVYDSAYFMYNNTSSSNPTLRRKYVDKYIVANMVTVTPFDWIDFSAGNSFIYGGSPRWEMFIPFMYYKVMDHNTGRQGVDDGNGMIFFDAKVKYPETYKFYGTLLIDVLNIRDILKGDWWKSWFGITLGAKKIDLIVPNLDVSIEYTRLNRWLYENRDEVSTYKHMNYVLGHWIGQNADEAVLRFDYKPLHNLKVSLTTEMIRKGGLKDISFAYKNREYLPFLYEPLRKEISIELNSVYEIFHDTFVEGSYKYTDIKDTDITRTPGWMLGSKHSFSLAVYYGI